MFLLFALGFFNLRCAWGAGCLADELAACGDTVKQNKRDYKVLQAERSGDLTFHRHYPYWLDAVESCVDKLIATIKMQR